MNESSIFSKYETFDSYGHEFDYQADFTQFLEAARKNANQETLNTANLQPERKNQLNREKKNKSWKKSLFSWLKTDKKSKSSEGSRNGAKITKPDRGHFSGQVQGTGRPVISGRAHRPASGPLTGLFGSTNRVEDYDAPYMCLGQLSNSQKLNYGPVYLVT